MRIKIIRTKKNKSTSVKHTCRWHQKPSYIPSANKDYTFSCAFRRDCLIEIIFFFCIQPLIKFSWLHSKTIDNDRRIRTKRPIFVSKSSISFQNEISCFEPKEDCQFEFLNIQLPFKGKKSIHILYNHRIRSTIFPIF